MSKKKIIILASIIVSVIIISLASSYALFTFNVTKNSNFKVAVGTLELTITDTNTEDKLIMDKMVPMKEVTALEQNGYTFTVTNTGTIDAGYTIYLDDVLLDGYGDRLDNSLININIYNHKEDISNTFELNSDTATRIIANGNLKAGENITYTLRMWLDYSAGNDSMNKYFATQIRIEGTQNNEGIYTENVSPIVYLNKNPYGSVDLVLSRNSTYTEYGVNKIEDDNDKILSTEATRTYEYYNGEETVKVNNIDTTVPGIYYVNYKIKDSDSNIGLAKRVVLVEGSSIPVYDSISDVISSFNEEELKDVIMCNHANLEDTTKYFDCSVYDSIEEALDSRTNGSIILTNDITHSGGDIPINLDQTIVLDLNGNTFNLRRKRIASNGNLEINDTGTNGSCISTGQVVSNVGVGELVINGGYFERTSGTGTAIYEEGTGKLTINGGKFVNSGDGCALQNRNGPVTEMGNIEVNGGVFQAKNGYAILNGYGILNINANDDSNPIHIYSENKSGIYVSAADSVINISGAKANECTNDATETTSGLCVYTDGDTSTWAYSAGIYLSKSTKLNISGGTIIGQRNSIGCPSQSNINITGGELGSIGQTGSYGIASWGKSTINISGDNTYIYARNNENGVALFISTESTANIYGGTIESTYNGIRVRNANLNIYNINITSSRAIQATSLSNDNTNNIINIYGGNFTGTYRTLTNYITDSDASTTYKIYGGIFKGPTNLYNDNDNSYIYYTSNAVWNDGSNPIIDNSNNYNIILDDSI